MMAGEQCQQVTPLGVASGAGGGGPAAVAAAAPAWARAAAAGEGLVSKTGDARYVGRSAVGV